MALALIVGLLTIISVIRVIRSFLLILYVEVSCQSSKKKSSAKYNKLNCCSTNHMNTFVRPVAVKGYCLSQSQSFAVPANCVSLTTKTVACVVQT